jgi:hypothetical protein
MQALVLPLATLSVVLLGIGLVIGVAFLPILVCFYLRPLWEGDDPDHYSYYHVTTTISWLLQIIHLQSLYKRPLYLSIWRLLVIPIRQLMMPFVLLVARIESIREQVPTLYFPTAAQPSEEEPATQEEAATESNDDSLSTPLLSNTTTTIIQQSTHPSFNPADKKAAGKIRRRYAQMQRAFVRDGITHQAHWSEAVLNLSTALPILWQHERRVTNTMMDAIVESIKRFLVLVCLPFGILDCYYDRNGDLVSIQLSIQTGNVWHWMMYFSKDTATKSGIWFHGIGTAQQRALACEEINYCNAQVHQTESKQNAGCISASYDDSESMTQLYPFEFTQLPPKHFLEISLWRSSHQEQQSSNTTPDAAESLSQEQAGSS